jgi:hypothetical protein
LGYGDAMSTKVTKTLYRSVRKDDPRYTGGVLTEDGEPAEGILHGDIDPRTVTVGDETQTRQDWQTDDKGFMKMRKGTSLWDKAGVFGNGYWRYFGLPEGTQIPASLLIREGNPSERYKATHFQIEVANSGTMTPDALRGALDNLARNAIVRAREMARI